MDKKLLNKNFIFSTTLSAFVYIASSMLISVLPRFLAENSQSKVVISFSMLTFTLSACFTRILWGMISNIKGRKTVVVIGIFFVLLSLIIFVFNTNIAIIFISRVLFGIGFSAVVTAAATLAIETTHTCLIPQAIAIYGLGGVLTQAVAPPLGLWIYNKYKFEFVVYAAIAITLLALLMTFFIKCKKIKIKNSSKNIFEKSAIAYSSVAGIITFASACVFTFVPLLAIETEIKDVSGFFILNAVGLLLSRLAFSHFSKNITLSKIFYIGAILFTASFLVIYISQSQILLTISGFFYGTGMGLVHPVVNTVAVKDKQNKAGAMAVFYTFQDIGLALGSLSCGFISESFGIKSVFLLCAAFAFLALILFLILKYFNSKK